MMPMNDQDILLPRLSTRVIGFDKVTSDLKDAFTKGRFPHGIILTGPKGIGKSTCAYQLAHRFLNQGIEISFDNLSVESPLSKTDKLIRAGNHPDLLVLERDIDEKGKLSKDIPIEKARTITKFFSQTSLTDNWRIAIIDAIDDLSVKGANTLLKILEEPPEKCLLILISHNQSGILPTLSSRCQIFSCPPLDELQFINCLEHLGISNPEIYAPYSHGSPGQALDLVNLGGQTFLNELETIVSECEKKDFRSLQPFLDRHVFKPLTLSPDQAYAAFSSVLMSVLAKSLGDPKHKDLADQRATSWFLSQDLLKQSHIFALDRKQTLLSVIYDFYDYNSR